jgi:hypothetical protein
LKHFRILMNEAGEAEGGGVGETVAEISTANEFGETKPEALLKDLGLDPEKYNLSEDDQPETPENEGKGEPDSEENDAQETEESSFLKMVNSLGAVRDGQPIEISSKEEVKNALQMYKDYTSKTQTLSEERKGFETEKASATQEFETAVKELNASIESHQAQLAELEQWTFALNQLKQEAPDIFEEVQSKYEGVKTQFSNPILEQQLKALRSEFEPLRESLKQRENEMIIKGFESEWEASKHVEQSLKGLGLNVDKEAVKKEWANTGLPVNKVIGALYGEQILKAQASKSKVSDVQKKVASKQTGAASASRPGSRVPDVRGTSNYLDAAYKLYESMR